MLSNPSLDSLTDQALLDQFGNLVQQGHHRTASLLRHIDAIDHRQLWAKYGHPSMFDFCVSRYHMSESTAGKRIGAARTARRFPVVFEMVARGEIHLSGIHRLKAHLTPENHMRVLAQATHKTIRQIEGLVAQLVPRPDVPPTLRRLPARSETAIAAPLAAEPVELPKAPPPLAAPAPPARRAPDPEPLAPSRYKLQVTIDEATHQNLRQLQDLLAHQIPNGDPAAIIERAFDALLAQVRQSKVGITEKPRARKAKARRARWIPTALRREVWARDDGRALSWARTGTAATRRAGSSLLTRRRGRKVVTTAPVISACDVVPQRVGSRSRLRRWLHGHQAQQTLEGARARNQVHEALCSSS